MPQPDDDKLVAAPSWGDRLVGTYHDLTNSAASLFGHPLVYPPDNYGKPLVSAVPEKPMPVQPLVSAPNRPVTLHDFSRAIAQEEGKPEAHDFHNPGNILGRDGKIVQFPNQKSGESALQKLLLRAAAGKSKYYQPDEPLNKFGMTYSGGDPNWSKNIAAILGIKEDMPIKDLVKRDATQPARQKASGNPTR